MVATLIDLPDSTVIKGFSVTPSEAGGGSLFSEVVSVLRDNTVHGLLFAQRQTHHHRRSHPSRTQQLLGQLLKKDKKATEECAAGTIGGSAWDHLSLERIILLTNCISASCRNPLHMQRHHGRDLG